MLKSSCHNCNTFKPYDFVTGGKFIVNRHILPEQETEMTQTVIVLSMNSLDYTDAVPDWETQPTGSYIYI